MIPAGYTAKMVEPRPEWLKADSVVDIYSVSECVSEAFCDYTAHWKHNVFWLFNSVEDLLEVARLENVDLDGYTLVYYEVFEEQYDETTGTWCVFRAFAGLDAEVIPPEHRELMGYDVVSFYAQTNPECSPLSCNGLAETIAVNSHCLVSTLEEAQLLCEERKIVNCEPGPYRIYAVYRCRAL